MITGHLSGDENCNGSESDGSNALTCTYEHEIERDHIEDYDLMEKHFQMKSSN